MKKEALCSSCCCYCRSEMKLVLVGCFKHHLQSRAMHLSLQPMKVSTGGKEEEAALAMSWLDFKICSFSLAGCSLCFSQVVTLPSSTSLEGRPLQSWQLTCKKGSGLQTNLALNTAAFQKMKLQESFQHLYIRSFI